MHADGSSPHMGRYDFEGTNMRCESKRRAALTVLSSSCLPLTVSQLSCVENSFFSLGQSLILWM